MQEIASLTDELDEEDRKTLTEILPDLASRTDTPKIQVAIVKMKKLLVKGGSVFAESFRKLLIDVLSETAKKALIG